MPCRQLFAKLWCRLSSRIAAYRELLTGDFDYSKNYFFGLDYLMVVAGVRLKSRKTAVRCVWNIYRGLLSVVSFIVLWNMIRNLVHYESLGLTLNSVQAGMLMVMTPMKLAIIARNFGPLMRVRRYVNRRHFGRSLDSSRSIRGGGFYRIRRIMVCNVVLMVIMIVPSIRNISSVPVLKMPFDVRDQMPLFQTWFERIISWVLIGYGMMIISSFIVVYMLLAGMTLELKVTSNYFEEIFQRAQDNTQAKLESASGSSDQVEAVQKGYFWQFLQEEFEDCIRIHQLFLTSLDAIRPMINAFLFVVYYSTATNLACGAFFVLYSYSFTSYSYQILYYSVLVLVECYILTCLVDQLTEANESVGEQLYNQDWPLQLEFDPRFAREYRGIKQVMMTVMAVSQQSLRLNCFELFEFTQERVTELVMMTYDVVSFFRNFV